MSMPRSLAGDRSSLSRGSVLTNRSDAISVGSAVTRHWVNSVSDIYGPDEIEELLEDLNRLEMASFDGVMIDYDGVRPTSSEMNIMQNEAVISGCITQGPPEEHDVEDFDIDGSQVKKQRRRQFDGGGHGAVASVDPSASAVQATGGHASVSLQAKREHPLPPLHFTAVESDTEAASSSRLSKLSSHQRRRGSSSWSVRSWDSHAHYQDFHNEDEDEEDETEEHEGGLFSNTSNATNVVCYCDMSTFKTPRTILRVLLVVTSLACLLTVLTAGTAKMGLFSLPHFSRLRIMMFITLFTVIFTIFILFLNISHLHTFMPVDYGKMQTVAYLLLTVAYAVASSLVFHSYLDDSIIPSLPHWTKTQTLIVALLGFTCAFETFLCSFNCGRPVPKSNYDKMAESSTHFTLHETVTTGGGQSRAVTDDSLKQKQNNETYLINENYDKSDRKKPNPAQIDSHAVQSKSGSTNKKTNGVKSANNNKNNNTTTTTTGGTAATPSASTSAVAASASVEVTTRATVENKAAMKNTGAIPKQKISTSKPPKPSTNHLDEIVALPLDDFVPPMTSAIAASAPPQPPVSLTGISSKHKN